MDFELSQEQQMIRQAVREFAEKEIAPNANVHLLAGFSTGGENQSVQDPFGGDLAAYRETADDLERELAGLLERIPSS